MMGLRRAVLLLLLAGAVLVACARGGADLPDVGLELTVDPHPPQIGPATLLVSLSDAAGQPIRGAQVELEGNMNHAGMVPVFATAVEVAPGRYRAELEFTMAGDWFILVRAALPDGRALERRVDLTGVDAVCGDTPQP
ncbi:MAG: FixH family protein [Anaerolineae bacterium]|jgi:hypothetical protein